MIPRKIHQSWLGSPIPEEFAAWGRRFVELNPGWEYSHHGDGEFAAACAVDAHLAALRDSGADWAAIMDRFRLLILREHGGAFFDSDAEPLRPLDGVLDVIPAAASLVMSATGSVQCMMAAHGARLLDVALDLWQSPGQIVRGTAVERAMIGAARPGEFYGLARWVWNSSPTHPRAFVAHDEHHLGSWRKWQ